MKIFATNIKWDTDGDKELLQQLPKSVEIPENVVDEFIADYLSDEYGFCHFGFDIEAVEDKNNIEKARVFIKENPSVAREIHSILDKDYHREDIVSKLEERGLINISDENIDKLVDSFERALSKNDGYYDAFWASVDVAIDEFVQKNSVQKKLISPPSLDELKREYKYFIDITKDVKTVEQAKEFEKIYHIPVEINGVPVREFENSRVDENIEWIRYEYCDHLWYLYDRFDGKPMFDVYYGPHADNCLVKDICINDLTAENYLKWLTADIMALAVNELDKNGNIGYTMPDGKHHLYIYVDDSITFADESKTVKDGYYVIEPNRVVDGAMEPMGDTVTVDCGDFDELRKGVQWCLSQFDKDSDMSLEDKLVLANDRSKMTDNGNFEKTEKDIEKE